VKTAQAASLVNENKKRSIRRGEALKSVEARGT
jgi:hypothetical protein